METKTTTTTTTTTAGSQPRGFATVSTPDGRRLIWLSRPTRSGRIHAACSFSLAGHMAFVDAIDTLGYVRVEQVTTYDEDYSSLTLSCIQAPEGCLERLMEDLPERMEECL